MFNPVAALTEAAKGAVQKGREAAAAKRYVQDTIDVIGYLREPLKTAAPEVAFSRIGAIAMLEALALFNDAMQHNPAWVPLDVPEPELIAVARGQKVPAGLERALEAWMKALAEPGNHDHWCKNAFVRHDRTIERQYYAVRDHAEAAMLLIFAAGLTAEGLELAVRLRDNPIDLRLLEQVRGLKGRHFF